MDFNKLLNAKRVAISYLETNVDGAFVKEFRSKNNLTQIALANILAVSTRTIKKWENNTKKIKGSSAVLLTLLNEDKNLLNKVYAVKVLNAGGGY